MEQNKKRRIDKIFVLFLIVALMAPLTVEAQAKTESETKMKRSETVYVLANAGGQVERQISAVHLHTSGDGIDVEEATTLEQITNVKGKQQPTVNQGRVHWKTDQADVFYQGDSNKKLPFHIDTQYYLDGQPISPLELVGRSGAVKIEFEVVNDAYEEHSIDGRNRKIYLPLTAATVINLPTETYQKVEINSGQLVNDGKNQMINFISFPGLRTSLDIKDDDWQELQKKLPERLIIQAQVEQFEMGDIVTVVTPDFMKADLFKQDDKVSSIGEKVDKLEQGIDDLSDGADKLYNGQKEFNQKTTELGAAFDQLNKGTDSLSGGLNELIGKFGLLEQGTNELREGSQGFGQAAVLFGSKSVEFGAATNQFAQSAQAFSEGAAGLAQAGSVLSVSVVTLNQSTQKLSSGIDQISQGLTAANQNHQALLETETAIQTGQEAVDQGINDSLAAVMALKKAYPEVKGLEQLEAGLTKISQGSGAVKQGLTDSHQKQTQLYAAYDLLAQSMLPLNEGGKALNQGVGDMKVKTAGLIPVAEALTAGSTKLLAGSEQIQKAADGLSEKSGGLNQAAIQISGGLEQLSGSITKFKTEGLNPLHQGSLLLAEGTGQLVDKKSALTKATTALEDGSRKLADGVREYKNQGIDKIETEMADITDLIEQTEQVDKIFKQMIEKYSQFSGGNADMEKSLKFIVKQKEVEIPTVRATADKQTTDPADQNKGFIGWLKSLFKH